MEVQREIFFPKKDVITRISSPQKIKTCCEQCEREFDPADNCSHCAPEEICSIGRCSICKKKRIFLLKECTLCKECFQDYEEIILKTGRHNLQLWTEE